MEDRDEAPDTPPEPPAQVPRAELVRRRDIMFSGVTGAVVGSGGGEATSAPTYEIISDVQALVLELPDALFDPFASLLQDAGGV